VLTLMFLPALYVAWYRLKEPSEDERKNVKQSKGD
jgi:hypothetical protein